MKLKVISTQKKIEAKKKGLIMENFNFKDMVLVALPDGKASHCDADGSQGSGCDCDSPN